MECMGVCCTAVEKVCARKGPPVALTANVQPTHVDTRMHLHTYKIIPIHMYNMLYACTHALQNSSVGSIKTHCSSWYYCTHTNTLAKTSDSVIA